MQHQKEVGVFAAVSGLVDVAGTSEEAALDEEALLEELFGTAEASRR